MTDSDAGSDRLSVRSVLGKALSAQRPVAMATVSRLRRVHPEKSPAEIITLLNRHYLATVTSTGAAAGAAAFVPNGWLQVPVAVADLATFLEVSVLYTLAVAEVHGVHPEDDERRRLLVTAVLLGDSAASSTMKSLFGRSVPYWGKKIVKAIPMQAIDAANKILGPRFITKWGTKQGVLVLGKQIPAGIGIGIGATGNHVFARFTISAAKKILGPAPSAWHAPEAQESLVFDPTR